MVEAVGIVGSGGGVDQMLAARTAAPAVQAAPSAPKTSEALRPLSPSVHLDPTAGVLITEYYSSSGELSGQIPSQAEVANLRAGLSGDGEARAAQAATPAGPESVGMVV